MALDNYHSYYVDDHFVLPPHPPPPQLDWDWDRDQLQLHTLGGGDTAQQGIHGAFLPAMRLESPESSSSEASSGYLQDAVAHCSDRCSKRQRMAEAAPPRRPAAAANEDLHYLLQSFWDSSSSGGEGGLMHDLNIMIPESGSFVSGDENDASGWEQEQGQRGPISAAATSAGRVPAAQGGGGGVEAAPLLHNHDSSPASSRSTNTTTGQGAAQQLQLQKATSAAGAGHAGAAAAGQPGRRGNYSCEEHVFVGKQHRPSPSSRAASASSPRSSSLLTGKEKRDTGVLYPFAVVKPLGLEGGGAATLNDVNQRILKRPARPVRHPVGQFACGPVVYAHGLGLSGKAVVSLTRIRTAGKGTITIIRTRG